MVLDAATATPAVALAPPPYRPSAATHDPRKNCSPPSSPLFLSTRILFPSQSSLRCPASVFLFKCVRPGRSWPSLLNIMDIVLNKFNMNCNNTKVIIFYRRCVYIIIRTAPWNFMRLRSYSTGYCD